MQANQTHNPRSKPPRNRGSERLKIVLAVILAGVLGVMLLPGNDASSDSGLEQNLDATVAKQPAAPNRLRNLKASEPARRSSVRLPSIDWATIAAHDPFSLPADKLPNLAKRSEQQTVVPEADQQLLAGPSQMRDVRAVYATTEGGAALVNGRVVPVSEPRKLMRAMRTD